MAEWSSSENGATLGQQGSEQGVVVADEEHGDGARITLERDGVGAPWAITCGVYGLLVHTRFFMSEAEARAAFDAMKEPLHKLAAWDEHDQGLGQAIENFVREFP